DDIEEHVIDDEQDDAPIRDKQRQLDVETRLCEELDVDEVDMTGTITLFGLTSMGPDETMSEYAGSLPEDPINLEPITQYLNSVDDYEGGARSEHLPVTPLKFHLDPGLQSLPSHLQSLQLNPTSLAEACETSNAIRERIHENQLQVNKRPIRQYGKQHAMRNFEIGESVGVAVPAFDRASRDDKRIFGQVKKVHNGPCYKIQIKYGVLDRNLLLREIGIRLQFGLVTAILGDAGALS
ncbi:hypothetical protein MMC31_006176, partial [Peltigera leucophlebia]|nr:hypothetical protein [Peltigera leucophlebia]